ncbi:MAG: hypothetical protein ABSG53_19080, partial [Thermoguttaceae bacterium]
MSIQQILWTALPNGVTPAGDHLRISVLVSPRLVTDNGIDGDLQQFPDFLDWPRTVAALRFSVEFQGGPSIPAAPVVEPGMPALDPAAWQALCHRNTTVKSYAFDDKSGLNVLSFPTRKIISFVKQQYQTVAITSPGQKPTIGQLGFEREPTREGLGSIVVVNRDDEEFLQQQLIEALKAFHHAVPASFGTAALDFYRARVMHQATSKVVRDADGHAQELPPQQPTEVDFHRAVAAIGQYQRLLRALGLAIDLHVPLAGVPGTSAVRAVPDLNGPTPMTPWTAYDLDAAKRKFVSASCVQSDVSDGMLLFSSSDQYDIVEMDVDGAASKVADFASKVGRIAFREAPVSMDTPDT